MRIRALLALTVLLLSCSGLFGQSGETAEAIVHRAENSAATQHKQVLLIFHATWCSKCKMLDRYLALPEVQPIIARYFVVEHLNAMEEAGRYPERNTPGANEMLAKLGGTEGVPFFLFLSGDGKVIANSIAPGYGSTGFPEAPQEIDWFMKMVAKAAPAMPATEARTLEQKLRHFYDR